MTFTPNDALLMVDLQNDFFPDGALGVPESDAIIPLVNQLISAATAANIPILASRDWHPEKHCSFKENGGPWPKHCVAETDGAAFHPAVNIPPTAILVNKATDPECEAYSAFYGHTAQQDEKLIDILKQEGIKRVWIVGLALDYCVKATAIDAVKAGFITHVIYAGTRAIATDTLEQVLSEMEAAGVIIER